jgi:hypothetical protein
MYETMYLGTQPGMKLLRNGPGLALACVLVTEKAFFQPEKDSARKLFSS